MRGRAVERTQKERFPLTNAWGEALLFFYAYFAYSVERVSRITLTRI